MPARIAIGEVLGAHGIGGELRVGILTDFPGRFARLKRVYLSACRDMRRFAERAGEEREDQVGEELEAVEFPVERARLHGSVVLLKLAGVNDRYVARSLKGCLIQVNEDELVPLPEGHYYVYQLVGLKVLTVCGRHVGVLQDVLRKPANDVYVVKRPEGSRPKEVLIPAVRDFVKEIDLEKGVILIDPVEGLLED